MSPVPGDNRTDITTPHPSRVYDCLLGGSDCFPADAEAAAWLTQVTGGHLPRLCAVNRLFVTAAVTRLASGGIKQFLDLASGLPVSGHRLPDGRVLADVHQTAKRIIPDAACVYLDRDGMTASHMSAAVAGIPGVAAVEADLRYPQQVAGDSRVWMTLDFTRPLAVLLTGFLGFTPAPEAADLIAGYARQLAPGSAMAVSTAWFPAAAAKGLSAMSAGLWHNHSPAAIQRWLARAGLRTARGAVADVRTWPMLLPGRRLSVPAVIGAVGFKRQGPA